MAHGLLVLPWRSLCHPDFSPPLWTGQQILLLNLSCVFQICFYVDIFLSSCFFFLKGAAWFWSTNLDFFFNFRIVCWHYFLDYVVASLIASIFDSLCLENSIFFLIFEKSFLINSSFFTMFLKLFSSCFFYFLLFLRWVPSLLFLFVYSISFPWKTAWFNFVLLFYMPLLESIWKKKMPCCLQFPGTP